MAVNNLWKSPQRAIPDDAETMRQEREADEALVRVAESFDKKKLEEELKKYENSSSNVKAFSILLS